MTAEGREEINQVNKIPDKQEEGDGSKCEKYTKWYQSK